MEASFPGYDDAAKVSLQVVEGSELRLVVDDEKGEAFEDAEYAAENEDTFREMMECFSPVSSTQLERWVAMYRISRERFPDSPFYMSGPFSGEGVLRVFDLIDQAPPTSSHPSKFQLFWEDNRGECVGNGFAVLFGHPDHSPSATALEYGSWANDQPTWAPTNASYEPLVNAVRIALLSATLEFGFESEDFKLSAARQN